MPMSSTTATPMTTNFITPFFLTGAGTASTSSTSLFFSAVAITPTLHNYLRVLLFCICHGKSKTGGLREQGVSLDAAADVNCLSSRSREAGKNTSKRIIPPALLHAAMPIVVAGTWTWGDRTELDVYVNNEGGMTESGRGREHTTAYRARRREITRRRSSSDNAHHAARSARGAPRHWSTRNSRRDNATVRTMQY